MTDYLIAEIRQRFEDVLCNGRGNDGSLGTTAQQRSLAAGQLRYSKIPLRDPGLSGSALHRAVSMIWQGIRDTEEPDNDANMVSLRTIRVQVDLGYLFGSALSPLVHQRSTGESTTVLTEEATAVAISDAEIVCRALMSAALTRSGPTLVPELLDVIRRGESRPEMIGGGRLVCSTSYEVRIQTDNTLSYLP